MVIRTLALATVTAATALGGTVLAAAPPAQAGAWDGKVVSKSALTVRYAPSIHSKAVGALRPGAMIPLGCKVRGPKVGGNDIWYSLPPTTHEWVSARYVRNIGRAPDWCVGERGAQVGRATTSLAVRTGPTTSDARATTYRKGSEFSIECKVRSQSVNGNSLWYWSAGHGWVSARYVKNVSGVPGWCTE